MRCAEERTFTTHDGEQLFYRHWQAVRSAGRAIVLFHRGHEHSGRLQHVVDELDHLSALDGYARAHRASMRLAAA